MKVTIGNPIFIQTSASPMNVRPSIASVNADLAASRQASISVGLAELEADDALENLVERADQALLEERRKRRSI